MAPSRTKPHRVTLDDAERKRKFRDAINITFDRQWDHNSGSGGARAPDHRLAGDGVPAAIRVSAGVAAILTSTSLTGFSVQACVT